MVGFLPPILILSLTVENAVCNGRLAKLEKSTKNLTEVLPKSDEGGLSSRAQSRRAPRRTCTRAEVGTVVVVGAALRTAQRASPLLFPETRDRQRGRERVVLGKWVEGSE